MVCLSHTAGLAPKATTTTTTMEKKKSFRIRPNYGPLPGPKNTRKRRGRFAEGGKSASQGTGERVSRPHGRTHARSRRARASQKNEVVTHALSLSLSRSR